MRALARYEETLPHLATEASAVMEQADDLERFDHARMRRAFEETEVALAEIDRDLAAAATVLMCSGLRMFPGLRRRPATPASTAASASRY